MEQRQRENVIKGFKQNAVKVLVATDVAARGIHVNNISHVFNYHIPFTLSLMFTVLVEQVVLVQKGKQLHF